MAQESHTLQATATLLIIDDDASILQVLAEAFGGAGYRVITAQDGIAGMDVASQADPDLVIVDLVMPKLDGYTFCQQFRQRSNVPIIVLSGMDDELHRIASFELGANDFVAKPFKLGELLARVRSLLRWHSHARVVDMPPPVKASQLEAGVLRVDPSSRQVWRNGEELEMTQKEFDLLVYLMQNNNVVLSRSHLLDQIWPQSYQSGPRTIDVHIHSLRDKIEDNPSAPFFIQTVRGVGYRFQMPRSNSVGEG